MEQRKRVNAIQGAKGDWKIDVTVEWNGDEWETKPGVTNHGLALDVLNVVKEIENCFRADGRKLAGDN